MDVWFFIMAVLICGGTAALYLEKLGDDHLEEALREMDQALTRMRR